MHKTRPSPRPRAGLGVGTVAALGAVTALLLAPPPATAEPPPGLAVCSDPPGGDPGYAVVRPGARERTWAPLTPSKWVFTHDQVAMVERGTAPPGPRRPFEYAVITAGPELGSLSYQATVRIDEPVTRNDRDVVLIFNYQSPTRFYYAHLSQDNTIYPHNGIFVVDDADRRRIDDQWNGSTGATPAIDDTDWHDVRLDYCADSGRIEVYVDGATEPLMTATDTTFAGGRAGFGSFDNFGRIRDVRVSGSRN